jgi:hypothetical protein
MAGFTNTLENSILNHIFGGSDYARPANLFIGLSTGTIQDDGSGLVEPAGNNYSRVSVTNNATNFPAASAGSKTNGTDIVFPTPSGSWGTVVDFFISDSSSGGTMLCYGTLTTPKAISNGDIVKFPTSSLTITLN